MEQRRELPVHYEDFTEEYDFLGRCYSTGNSVGVEF